MNGRLQLAGKPRRPIFDINLDVNHNLPVGVVDEDKNRMNCPANNIFLTTNAHEGGQAGEGEDRGRGG